MSLSRDDRQQSGYSTPVKNRIIAENQQIVRVDHEQIIPLDSKLIRTISDRYLPQILEGVKVTAISDYGKGFLISYFTQEHHQMGQIAKGSLVLLIQREVILANIRHATIIKPNLSEAFAAANLPPSEAL